MTPDQILADFARGGVFPRKAMLAATEQRSLMTPIFVDLVQRFSSCPTKEITPSEDWQILPALHLLAQWRETAAYEPFLTMMRREENDIEYLLGDTITESADRILASVFNGNLAPLLEAIEDPAAYDFARSSMFRAMIMIADLNPHLRPDVETFIRGFRTNNNDLPEFLLQAWVDGIAYFGLADMIEQVRTTYARGDISSYTSRFEHFEEELQASLRGEVGRLRRQDQRAPIESAIDEMSWWHCYSESYREEQRNQSVQNVLNMPTQKDTFPNLKVGRNDPCPCGSGKKYKKCCLQ